MNQREFEEFFGNYGYYNTNGHRSGRGSDWSGYRSAGVGYSEAALLIPKDREIEKCINDLLIREEDPEALEDYAEDVRSYFASIGGMWKNKWKKRASQLAALKRHTEARRPQHAQTE